MTQNGEDAGNVADIGGVIPAGEGEPRAHQAAHEPGKQHGGYALEQIPCQYQSCHALAEAPEGIGKPGVVTAQLPDILSLDELGKENGTVAAAQQIRQQGSQKGCQNKVSHGYDRSSSEGGSASVCSAAGNHWSPPPRSRITNRMGVPVSPKVVRIWFSIYRW